MVFFHIWNILKRFFSKDVCHALYLSAVKTRVELGSLVNGERQVAGGEWVQGGAFASE